MQGCYGANHYIMSQEIRTPVIFYHNFMKTVIILSVLSAPGTENLCLVPY